MERFYFYEDENISFFYGLHSLEPIVLVFKIFGTTFFFEVFNELKEHEWLNIYIVPYLLFSASDSNFTLTIGWLHLAIEVGFRR